MSFPLDTAAPPVPLRLPTPDRRALRRRAARIVGVVVRRLGPPLARRLVGKTQPPTAFARPLREVFETLGATFVKFGQLVASAPGAFGDAIADEFRSCLDTGPSVPFAEMRAAVELALGATLEDAFASFEETPIGRASIAVVHRARLRDGHTVAVKVLRPDIEAIVATDLRLMGPLFDFLAFRVGVPEAGQLVRMLDGFREQLAEELDLRNEARAMEHHRRLVASLGLSMIVVPATFPELSGQRVLTMDYLDGIPIDDVAGIAALGLQPRPLLEQLMRAWFITALRDGTFHADVHAGNVLLLRDGRAGVVDWGIVGRLDEGSYRVFRRALQACLGDESAWEEMPSLFRELTGMSFLQDGLGMSKEEAGRAVRAGLEPILTGPLGQLDLTVLFAPPPQANGQPGNGHKPSRTQRWRRMRRAQRMAIDSGQLEHQVNRSGFLLSKQLIYLERYGKMYIPDVALLGDREYVELLLADPPRFLNGAQAPSASGQESL